MRDAKGQSTSEARTTVSIVDGSCQLVSGGSYDDSWFALHGNALNISAWGSQAIDRFNHEMGGFSPGENSSTGNHSRSSKFSLTKLCAWSDFFFGTRFNLAKSPLLSVLPRTFPSLRHSCPKF